MLLFIQLHKVICSSENISRTNNNRINGTHGELCYRKQTLPLGDLFKDIAAGKMLPFNDFVDRFIYLFYKNWAHQFHSKFRLK